MAKQILFIIISLVAHSHLSSALWSCSQDLECANLPGSICFSGACRCRPGTEAVLGGTVCVDLAPYYTSTCIEDHQCSRLFTSFECRRENSTESGSCFCQEGFHYFLGRCWRSLEFGSACTLDHECYGVIQDPFSLKCDTTCVCGDGYYERQRGECRKRSFRVGEGCVLDQDCEFEGGRCDLGTFSCYNVNDVNATANLQKTQLQSSHKMAGENEMAPRQHGVDCSATSCGSPFVCSAERVCLCSTGYYVNEDGTTCLAELGSPSTEEQCVGLLAEVRDGICACPVNFFYDENMRDCIKVSRRITDSCLTDANCHTFGATARCGAPQDPWGFRNCECYTEESIWDATLNMCRLFAGIGESCELDSDCLAGDLEILCRSNGTDRVCVCPDNTQEFEGLCLTIGLELGAQCQHSLECSQTPNTICEAGRCSCVAGYQETDDICAPTIGGSCAQDADCVIENTSCFNTTAGLTCQCREEFVTYSDECWPVLATENATCLVSAQCEHAFGDASSCIDSQCACRDNHHFRDGNCWPVTGLFESCSRTSQCYLQEFTERVVCRNGFCMCGFEYPYSEETGICTSSATHIAGGVLFIVSVVLSFLSR